MKASDVSRAVVFGLWNPYRQIIVPNVVGMTGEEADLLVLHESGYMEEVEIKISKSDFKREFVKKADKHKMLLEGTTRYVSRFEHPALFDEAKGHPKFEPIERHGELAAGRIRDQLHTIRRFWFAMPEALATELENEIPEWAGLIAVRETSLGSFHAHIICKAPNLKNSRKVTDAERLKLTRYGYVRYWDMRLRQPQEFAKTVAVGNELEDPAEMEGAA